MPALTPPPLPHPRADEVTQPNAAIPTSPDEGRRGIARSPAQWEAEALATVEEADGRTGPAAGALRYAAARMLEDGVGDLAGAIDHLQLAVDEPPGTTFRPVLRALRLHAIEAGSFWSAIDLLDLEIGAAGTAAERADLAVEKAELLEHDLMAAAEARAALEEALAAVPGHAGALLALEQSALRADDAALLEAVIARRLAAATSAGDRARLLCRQALLFEADPDRIVRALQSWMRALDEPGGEGAAALARAGVRRVAARLGRHAELARAVGLEAEATRGAERAGWLGVAAALARHRLGAAKRATALIEEARGADPDEPALLMAAASSFLEEGAWAKGRAVLDHHAGLTRDRDWGAALLGLAAHVAESHENDDLAAATRYKKTLEARPGDAVALAALERIASRTGDAAAQVSLAEGEVDRSADPGERAALALRAAELAETAAHDPKRAAGLARRALDAVPGYAPAVHLLERLYPALGQWEEMAKVVEGDVIAAEAGDAAGYAEGERSLRLERLGALYEEPLRNPGKALALYGEWAELGTRRPTALRALLRAAEKAGDGLVAAEAAFKLGAELVELPVETRCAWCCRAASVYEERAAADDEAIRAYAAALELVPRFRPALAGLARAYRRLGQYDALAAVLAQQAACEPSPAGASALEVEGARIYALRLGRIDDALAATGRALAFDPANTAALAEHARLLGRAGRAEEQAAALGTLAQMLSDPADKAAVYRLQAEIVEWQLERRREALAAIERSFTILSGSAAAGSAGAGASVPGLVATEIAEERLLQLVGRGAEASARRLRLDDEPTVRPALPPPSRNDGRNGSKPDRKGVTSSDGELGRRLDFCWRLGEGEAARRALAGALERAPLDGAVLDAAVALSIKLDRSEDLALAFERLAEGAGDKETAAALWRGAARERRRGQERDDVPEGIALLRRVVEARPTDEALALLDRRATRAGDWSHAILARRQLADAATEPLSRAVLLWELGSGRLQAGDLAGADADFARAVEAEATFLPALRALARLREARSDFRSAAELYAREARLTKAPGRAAEGFRQAARLYSQQVRDATMAARCLEEVLALEPESESDFEALDDILRERGDFERLAQVMRRRAAAGPVPKRRDRLLALAELIYPRDPTEAATVLSEAVSLDPTSVSALVRLAEIETELGRSAEAIATYRLAIAASSDPKVVSAAWVQIGDIAERALADGVQAVEAYRNALLSTPDDIPALSGLVRGLTRQRDYTNAAITLRRLAAVESDDEARVGHLVTLGELLAGAAEDPEGAADVFEQALAIAPGHEVALNRLDALLTTLGEPSRLAAALGRFLEVVPAARERRVRLASLWSGPLGAPERAVDELRIVVEGQPGDAAVRAELARVLEMADRLPEAITEHLAVLRLEPLAPVSLRALKRLCERTGQRRRAQRVAAALAVLGLSDAAETRLVAEARLRWSPETASVISGADFEAFIRHPDERHPATSLLAAMSEVLPRLYGLTLEDWGVTRQDRIAPRSEDPVRALVGRVAALLAVEEAFDVYLARTIATQVEVEAGPPPALLVPPALLGLPRQEAYRQLGRQLGHVRAGTYAIGRIPPKDLGLLVVAGVRTVYPDYGRGLLPEEQLDEVAQKIARMLPRRFRRAFEQAALSFRDGGLFDADRWRAGLVHTGHRAGLVASGDVIGTFEQIARGDRALASSTVLSPDERLAAARANAEVVQMIHFAVGEELAAISRRLGVD